MLKIKTMSTPIKIQNIINTMDSSGFPAETIEESAIIFCEWKNVFGQEIWAADAVQAQNAATLRLWYEPSITNNSRILNVTSGMVFEIVSIDNVGDRGQIMELKVRRWVNG